MITVGEVGHEGNDDDTMHYIDYEFSDLECDLDILESKSGNSSNVTNYDKFDKILLKNKWIKNLFNKLGHVQSMFLAKSKWTMRSVLFHCNL